eukprot:TRINITY_DN9029_c0_g1_i1.p1 TRINITY_DN9029_c0_g1~~TRINITY_DN9029_c0_g1_i1.p1  ORF type:complete len:204 (+),score=18.90 TRINITY_DN9029_c0_g1_i1:105-716(+)
MDVEKAVTDIKCVGIGKAGVGQKSLYFTYMLDHFPLEYYPAVHDNPQRMVEYESKQYRITYWMSYGAEDYDRLRPLIYPGAQVVLLLFSVMDPDSFNLAETQYLPEAKQYCDPTTQYLLVGTKTDLRDDEAACNRLLQAQNRGPLTHQEGEMKVRDLGLFRYHEISARGMEGVRELLDLVVLAHLSDRPNAPATHKGAKCVMM